MGLFSRFNKDKKESQTTDNGVSGPTFLASVTEHIDAPGHLEKHEWRRRLVTSSGERKFRIKYAGQLHRNYKNLIVGKGEVPALVVAVAVDSAQEIVIFDGCRHGYNALLCGSYSEEQKDRSADHLYKDPKGNDTFEIAISAYYSIDLKEESGDAFDENGMLELIDGSRIDLETAKRNAFDVLQIFGTTNNGDKTEIVSEELA